MSDIVFDLAITLLYVLDLGEEEMEIIDKGDSEENADRRQFKNKRSKTIQPSDVIAPVFILMSPAKKKIEFKWSKMPFQAS